MSIFDGSQSRSVSKPDHTVITPESHVPSALPGWVNTMATIVIAPRIGAKFAEYFVDLSRGATSAPPPAGVQRFVYVLDGVIDIAVGGQTHALAAGAYAYLPAGVEHTLTAQAVARAIVVEKPYVRAGNLARDAAPAVAIGVASERPSRALWGDPDMQVTQLLPDEPAYDMAMNIMAFSPGAALGLVESHVMEHGLLMLSGQGIYRLNAGWYPVKTGDVIYMAPYCPQWFAPFGKERAAYLLYKDWNRDPFGY